MLYHAIARPRPRSQVKLIVPKKPSLPTVVPLPTPINGIATFELGSAPQQLLIAGTTYTPTPTALVPGTFTWDPAAQTVSVALQGTPAPGSGAIAYHHITLPTNYVPPPYPHLLTQLPLDGTFSWSLSWEGHPSGSFRFRTLAQRRTQVVQALQTGAEFTAWGIGFRVNSCTIREVPAASHPQRLIEVDVSLGGKHENYTDRKITLLHRSHSLASEDELDPDCVRNLSQQQQDAVNFPTRTSVSALAIRAGDRFTGIPLPVRIPRDTQPNTTTTFIAEAQSRIRLYGGVLNFDDPKAVVAKALTNVPTHFFNETEIRSEVSASIQGVTHPHSLTLSSLQLASPSSGTLPASPLTPPPLTLQAENLSIYPWSQLYDPWHRVEGEFSASGRPVAAEQEDTQSNGETQKPNWKQHEPIRREEASGDTDYKTPPAGTGRLKDLSLVESGPRKVYRIQVTEDGLPVESQEVEYRFIFYAKDMYDTEGNLFGAAPATSWQQSTSKITTYPYDGRTGYALGSNTVGWEMMRFLDESEALETITLDRGDPVENALYNCRIFFPQPFHRQERVALDAHRLYYKDVPRQPFDTYKVCLPSGRSRLEFAADQSFVEDYFVREETVHENCFAACLNPEHDPLDVPPGTPKYLTTGKESFHRRFVGILPSKNTKSIVGLEGGMVDSNSFGRLDDVEDAFNTYNSQYSSQDANWNSLSIVTFERSEGRPPVAPRKPSRYEREEPEGNDQGPKPDRTYTYYLYSGVDPRYNQGGNVTGVDPLNRIIEGGTISYPSAITFSEILKAAQTDLTISNIQGGVQENFTLPFSPNLRPVDRLNYVCNSTIRQRRVVSVQNAVEIKGLFNYAPILTSNGTQVTVGLERVAPLHSRRIRNPQQKDESTTDTSHPDVIRLGYRPQGLGEILTPGLQSRRNFDV